MAKEDDPNPAQTPAEPRPTPAPPQVGPARGRARWPMLAGAVVAALVVVIGLCEAAGWPFLVAPMQRWFTGALDRRVTFTGAGEGRGVRIGLIGSVRIDAASIEIAAPAWSRASHMILVHEAELRLAYGDLWRAHRGHPLRIRALHADHLDAQVERLADGRASWQFGRPKAREEVPAGSPHLPSFADLRVRAGTLIYRDAVMEAELDARFSLIEHGSEVGPPGQVPAQAASRAATTAAGSSAVVAAAPEATASAPSGLQFKARGTFRTLPLRVDLLTSSALSLSGEDGAEVVHPVTLDATVGRARMTFRGVASDPIHVSGLRGRFEVEGPSLAAVGDLLGITLPTTGPFKTDGYLANEDGLWKTVFRNAAIGDSRLAGAFTYDRRPSVPVLAGRLTGSRLFLRDLGPTVGLVPRAAEASAKAQGAASRGPNRASTSEPRASATARATAPSPAPSAAVAVRRVLPDRRFDLPSLRAMDADILVDIDYLDLGTPLLEPFEPLRAHLRLVGGVLTIGEFDARTAQGRLDGQLVLDGRNPQAVWTADLQLAGVRLEHWLHQKRRKHDVPPYVSGLLDGQVKVSGRGRSTAEILSTLEGGMRFHVRQGMLSHLAIEAAGIDVAETLGRIVIGDEALPVTCNIADLAVEKGVAKPRVFVVDTKDSTVWVDGTVSLAQESLDLKAVVSPKDMSPLTLRTPIRVRGTFSDPKVSLEKDKVAAKVGAAALLALVNPLAAIVPFIDPGSKEDAEREGAACAALGRSSGPYGPAPPKPAAAAAARR